MEAQRLRNMADTLAVGMRPDTEMVHIKKSQANIFNRSKLESKKLSIWERDRKAEGSLEELKTTKAADTKAMHKGIDKSPTEKRLKWLEKKVTQMLEEMIDTRLHCEELDAKLKYYQQELDVTKKAYAELIFYELNKGNKVLKMNHLNKDEGSQCFETKSPVGSSNKVKTEVKRERLRKVKTKKKRLVGKKPTSKVIDAEKLHHKHFLID